MLMYNTLTKDEIKHKKTALTASERTYYVTECQSAILNIQEEGVLFSSLIDKAPSLTAYEIAGIVLKIKAINKGLARFSFVAVGALYGSDVKNEVIKIIKMLI
jgi:hypothetical protein